MNSRNPVCRAITLFAVSLSGLSGCGGGDHAAVPVPTAQTAVNPTSQTAAKVPAPPTNVSAAGGTNKTTLSWDAAGGADSYTIYWSRAAGVTTATGTGAGISVSGTSYIHRALAPATTYYYVVTARNGAGESAASPPASAATTATDGATPYASHCAACHGGLATSTVTNRGSDDIEAALQNVGAMNDLSPTAAQIAAISAALSNGN